MSLEYHDIYHCRCSIILDCGRTVFLDALHQERTYRGLMMGVPNAEVNDLTIEAAVEAVAKEMHPTFDAACFLIDPPRRAYCKTPGDMQSHRRHDWIPEWLPMITCIAAFTSDQGIESHRGTLDSALTVIWFQDEYALPISDLVLEQIKSINWDKHADGYDLD